MTMQLDGVVHRLPIHVVNKIETTNSGCWIWTGAHTYNGYGVTSYRGARTRAHRLTYQILVGPIPDGLDLDHLCRVRDCVNPEHLEPVTRKENMRRSPIPLFGGNPRGELKHGGKKTHCKHGHEFTPENTYVYPGGPGRGLRRHCRTCRISRSRRMSGSPQVAS